MVNTTIVSEARTTKEEIDDRIKRLSRKFLCDMAPERDKMLGLRDYYWAMSEYLAECGDCIERELRKKRRKNPKWKRDRPKPSEVRAEEEKLKSFIGHDVQKLELMEQFLSWFPLVISDPMKAEHVLEQVSDSLNGKKLQNAVRVFTRGKGGAPKKNDDVMPKAYEMCRAGKKTDEIARECWPEAYKQNRFRATNRMKAALYRHKKRIAQSPPNTKTVT